MSLCDSSAPAAPVGISRIIVGSAAVAKFILLGLNVWNPLSEYTLRMPIIPILPAVEKGSLGIVIGIGLCAAIAFAFGWRTRTSGSVLAACAGALLLWDQQLYSNHLYLMLILVVLLTLAGSGATYSLDARRVGRRESIAAWPIFLLKAQLSIVYGFAAIAKLNAEFLSGGVIYVNWSNWGLLPLPDALAGFTVMAAFSFVAVVVEIVLAFGFWSPRLVRPCAMLGLGSHAFMIVVVGWPVELLIFAAMMASLYVLFVPPERSPTKALKPHSVLASLRPASVGN